jgi:hypothetical protein
MKYLSRATNVAAGVLLLVILAGVASFVAGGKPSSGSLSMAAFVAIVASCAVAHFFGAVIAWRVESGHRSVFAAYGLGAASISTFVWTVICWGALAMALNRPGSMPPWAIAVFAIASVSLPGAGVLNFLSIKRAAGETTGASHDL